MLDKEVVARTNNPLERFNCTLNERCSKPKPSIPFFVNTICQLSVEYVTKLKDINVSRSKSENGLSYFFQDLSNLVAVNQVTRMMKMNRITYLTLLNLKTLMTTLGVVAM